MKFVKTTLLAASVVMLSTAATAQSTAKRASTTAATTTTSVPDARVDQEYALETAKLKQGFKSGEIPSDFPKYDQSISAEDNKKIGLGYLSNHKDLLTDEAIAKLKKKGL